MASSTTKPKRQAKPKPAPTRSALEATLEWQLKAAKLWDKYRFAREVMLIDGRRWRWDFAAGLFSLAIECEGGTWMANRGHTSGVGIQRDIEKQNAATLAGWHTLRFTKAMIDDGTALRQIEEFLKRGLSRGRTGLAHRQSGCRL